MARLQMETTLAVLGDGRRSVEHSTQMQRKRQTAILHAGIGLFVIYFCLQLVPTTTRMAFALTAVPCFLLLTGYVIGYTRLRNSKLRIPYRAVPFLLAAIVVFLLFPDLRRARLRGQLETLGARVTLDFDESYRFLPRWLKEELDWALLGRIKQVDFSHKTVPVAKLKALSFDEPVWFLNLEGSDISRADLNQMPDILDARRVHLSRTRANESTLELFTRMPSIKILHAIQSDVNVQAAVEFRKRYPKIDLEVGNAVTMMVPNKTTEPRDAPESSN